MQGDVAKEMAKILYETALLESGFNLEDPSVYAARVYDTVRTNLGIDPNAEVEPEEETVEEESEAESKVGENKHRDIFDR